MRAASSYPSLVYIVGERKAVDDVRTVSPSTAVGYRDGRITANGTFGEDIALPESLDACFEAGKRRFDLCWTEYAGIPATFFSFFNEWLSKDNPNLMRRGCRVYEGVMAAARGKCRVAVGDLNWGQPEINPDMIAAMQPMLTLAQDEEHVLVAHWYCPHGDPLFDPPNHGLRWTRLGNYPRLKVAITEYAADADEMPHGEGFERLLVEGDRLYAPYREQVLGLCLYTLIGRTDSQWAMYNFEQDLDRYSTWLTHAQRCTARYTIHHQH